MLRPNILLYGEPYPYDDLLQTSLKDDLGQKPTVLLILGTSLHIPGCIEIVKEIAKDIHLRGGRVIYVNQISPTMSKWNGIIDCWIDADCDEWVELVQYHWDAMSNVSSKDKEANPTDHKAAYTQPSWRLMTFQERWEASFGTIK